MISYKIRLFLLLSLLASTLAGNLKIRGLCEECEEDDTVECKDVCQPERPKINCWILGKTGEAGDTGCIGSPGEPGNTGAIGDIGATGNPGQDGQPGKDGKDGAPGNPGEQGPQGDVGIPGPPGVSAEPGVPGPQGPAGEIGNPGNTGARGDDCVCDQNQIKTKNSDKKCIRWAYSHDKWGTVDKDLDIVFDVKIGGELICMANGGQNLYYKRKGIFEMNFFLKNEHCEELFTENNPTGPNGVFGYVTGSSMANSKTCNLVMGLGFTQMTSIKAGWNVVILKGRGRKKSKLLNVGVQCVYFPIRTLLK